MIVAAFISDRGDRYLPDCIESFCMHAPRVGSTTVIDDSDHQLGMAGAVQTAWKWALEEDADFLWHQEEDFLFDQAIPIYEMAAILDNNPHLAQVVLKRQPWSAEEKRAGGVIESNSAAYTQCASLVHELVGGTTYRLNWVEHEQIFSLNPTLIPRRTLELGWPSGPLGVGNESGMTRRCLDAGMRFAFYGHRDDPPRTIHVGSERAAGWRL